MHSGNSTTCQSPNKSLITATFLISQSADLQIFNHSTIATSHWEVATEERLNICTWNPKHG